MSIKQADIEAFRADGAALIKGLFADWVETLRDGVERNLAEPGEYAAENLRPEESGRFFDDYCNWQRIPEFERVIFESAVGETAAELMQSERVQLFHDHVLVKEADTHKKNPVAPGFTLLLRRWHADRELLGSPRPGG